MLTSDIHIQHNQICIIQQLLLMGNSTVTRVTFLSIGDTKISFINHILLFSNPSFVCC